MVGSVNNSNHGNNDCYLLASGLLLQLLQDLPTLLNKPLPAVISCSVQTESEDQLTVRKKQEEIEDSDDEQSIERRMLAFQRDCENRNKRMLELEVRRERERERGREYKNKLTFTNRWHVLKRKRFL